MKRLSLIGVSVLVLSLMVAPLAVAGDTANADATADVIQAISISSPSNLEFGDIVADSTGDVTVPTTGQRSAPSGPTLAGGTVSLATFDISGASSHKYQITVSATIPMSLDSDDYLQVTGWQGDPTLDDSTITLPPDGSVTLNLGGTLNLGNTSISTGTYSHSFTVEVQYQ